MELYFQRGCYRISVNRKNSPRLGWYVPSTIQNLQKSHLPLRVLRKKPNPNKEVTYSFLFREKDLTSSLLFYLGKTFLSKLDVCRSGRLSRSTCRQERQMRKRFSSTSDNLGNKCAWICWKKGHNNDTIQLRSWQQLWIWRDWNTKFLRLDSTTPRASRCWGAASWPQHPSTAQSRNLCFYMVLFMWTCSCGVFYSFRKCSSFMLYAHFLTEEPSKHFSSVVSFSAFPDFKSCSWYKSNDK